MCEIAHLRTVPNVQKEDNKNVSKTKNRRFIKKG